MFVYFYFLGITVLQHTYPIFVLIRYHNTLFKLQIILILVGAFRVGGARTPNSYESSACESRALTASAPILNDLSIITYLYVMLETEK